MSERRWLREATDALFLSLRVQPGARRTEVVGVHGEGAEACLRIRLAAPPVEGKANAELVRFLCDAFGVPSRAVVLLRGEASRQKRVRIDRPTLRPDQQW